MHGRDREKDGMLVFSLARTGTREIDLEGMIMNLGLDLYTLNLRYQQYLMTYKSCVLIETIRGFRRLTIQRNQKSEIWLV